MYNVTLRHVRATIVAVEKKCVTYSDYEFVALGIQHSMRMRHVVIFGLPRSTIFSTLCHKWNDFRRKKKTLLNIKRVFF